MSATPGWYPDPSGRPGSFRYWDGRSWSAETRAQPGGSPPDPAGPSRPSPTGNPRRRSVIGWVLGAIAVGVVVIIVIVVLAVRAVTAPGPIVDPGSQSSGVQCPTVDQTPTAPTSAPVTGDRVVSGKLSVAKLPPPFLGPVIDNRVPFGHDVRSQDATIEEGTNGEPSWLAGVLVARLLAGDGFYGPEQGAQLVVPCIVGVFYGPTEVQRDDVKNEATTVGGRPAWLIESNLSFQIAGVEATGELLIVVVVEVGAGEAGLFYASIPNNAPELVTPAREALADLRVDG